MQKRQINTAGLKGLMNRGQALGPGVLRLAADQETDSADVFIYGDIGGWWGGVSAEQFSADLAALDVETLNIRINSNGGLVFEGVSIYNALVRQSAKVIVHIDGIAASIASVIAMAGDEIRISEAAHLMIHKPWSMAMGDADVMRKEADILDELEDSLIDIYAARTDNKRSKLSEWLSAETWFRGQKAVDEGFADTMVPAKKKEKKDAHARSALLPLFLNTPKDLLEETRDDPVTGAREFERLLLDGEGLTHAQAKRIAAQARKAMFPGLRDEAVDTKEPNLRDEGGADMRAFAQFLRSL